MRIRKDGQILEPEAARSNITFTCLSLGVIFSYANAKDEKNVYMKISDSHAWHLNTNRPFHVRHESKVLVYTAATVDLGEGEPEGNVLDVPIHMRSGVPYEAQEPIGLGPFNFYEDPEW